MIWISTLCLLAVAVWLFFNALNERRWVESHSHDETVASDEGLLPGFTALTRTASPNGSAKQSMNRVSSGLSQAADKVKETTSKAKETTSDYKNKLTENRAAPATSKQDSAQSSGTPASSAQGSVFSRIVEKVGSTADAMDQRLDSRVKAATGQTAASEPSANANTSDKLRQTTKKVALKSEELAQKIAHKTKVAADNYGKGNGLSSNDGLIGKVATSVSGGIGSVEKMVKDRLANRHSASQSTSDELIARVSAKVGANANQKHVESERKITDKANS